MIARRGLRVAGAALSRRLLSSAAAAGDSFAALWVDSSEDNKPVYNLRPTAIDELGEGDVTVDIEYSSLNYKDAMALTLRPGVVRKYPMVPGIDLAGTVRSSDSDAFQAGDRVVLTGWGVGEQHTGGYAARGRFRSEWLLPLPEGLSARDAMAIGTGGLTAAMCVNALSKALPDKVERPVAVSGASGGVGSFAVALLHAKAAQFAGGVAAVTGRASNADWLRSLGATEVLSREDVHTTAPLQKEQFCGAVDAVGGGMLASLLARTQYGGSVAACGLAESPSLATSVFPFILRGVSLLGIDSVRASRQQRLDAWSLLATSLPADMLAGPSITEVPLRDVSGHAEPLIEGRVRGRVVVATGGQ
ncbi:hypothetical protein FNF29_02688 [Cafeteria roenbergensis]|uniref:Enoyl reductase (ER) domain-containing protein n=1 Tax=Cafeteria roenbergensis TaxID=33653 RepID=A0A5A8CM00_CAFRO|nr:hypothetical protein FNF29_02688 [Cafeteria roenbergensis]|eukprot:KAA0154065.1 hypothetical protein FNF29_02688 [Cafeteria roenbergensis]